MFGPRTGASVNIECVSSLQMTYMEYSPAKDSSFVSFNLAGFWTLSGPYEFIQESDKSKRLIDDLSSDAEL
jgi:hypothetical protein